MTDDEMKILRARIITAENLKKEIKTANEIAAIVDQNRNGELKGLCGAYKWEIGAAILKWTSSNEDEFNTFMEFLSNHTRSVQESLDAV